MAIANNLGIIFIIEAGPVHVLHVSELPGAITQEPGSLV